MTTVIISYQTKRIDINDLTTLIHNSTASVYNSTASSLFSFSSSSKACCTRNAALSTSNYKSERNLRSVKKKKPLIYRKTNVVNI